MPDHPADPVIIVHHLDHMVAALTAARDAGRTVVLRSAEGAVGWLGAPVMAAQWAAARAAVPGARATYVADCGDAPGLALNALRHGLTVLRLEAPAPVLAKVQAMAAARGARLIDPEADTGPVLDLLDQADPAAACRAVLDGKSDT